MQNQKGSKQKNLSEYYKRIRSELERFYRNGKAGLSLRHPFRPSSYLTRSPVSPDCLEIVARTENPDEEDFYYEELLPNFLKFSKEEGFDIIGYSREKYKEPFQRLLNSNIENFNSITGTVLFRGDIYFVRCRPKEITGLPRNQEERLYYLTAKKLFNYEYRKISERGFFEMVIDYIDLYEREESLIRRNIILWVALLLAGSLIITILNL